MAIRVLRKQFNRLSGSLALYLCGVIILACLFLNRIRSLVHGANTAEVQTKAASWSLHAILNNPLNAPYKLLAHVALHIAPHSTLSLRFVSTFYGILVVTVFFLTLRHWYNTRIGLLGSALFASSSWILHSGRLGTPDVLLGTGIVLCGILLWLRHTKHGKVVSFLIGVTVVGLLYVPGMIWFIIATIIIQPTFYKDLLRHTPKWLAVLIGFGVILLCTPLIWAMVHNHSVIWAFLGLPSHVPHPSVLLHQFGRVGVDLFVRGPLLPGAWVGRTPLLDVFDSILFLLGLYSMWQHKSLKRVQSLAVMLGVSYILIALNGPVTFTVILPFMYLVIAIGIAYLLIEWFTVFPLNPIARQIGMWLLIIAVATSCSYQLSRYFIAWPHTPGVSTTFNRKL